MHILFVCHYFTPEPAAPAARVHELARAWVSQGHRVTVLTAMPNHPTGVLPPAYRGRLAVTEWVDGIRVLRCWLYARPARGVGNRGATHLTFMVSSVLLGLPRIGPFDLALVSSPTLFSALSAWLIARVRRVPLVLEVRDLWPEAFVELGVMRDGRMVRALSRLARFLYRQAARVVVVTRSFGERIQAQGIAAEKIAFIPNGADTRRFQPGVDGQPTRAALGLEGRFVVGYVGSHGVSHGLDVLLDAAERLPEVAFLLVGDGAERERLIAERDRRGLENVVMRTSVAKADVAGLYAACDVCVVPLRNVPIFETFIPSKMFEMMAMGRPIVAAVRGEARSILQESGGALLVEPENGEQLAEAIARLRDEPALREQLERCGRAFVEQHYDREVLARRYEAILRETLAESR